MDPGRRKNRSMRRPFQKDFFFIPECNSNNRMHPRIEISWLFDVRIWQSCFLINHLLRNLTFNRSVHCTQVSDQCPLGLLLKHNRCCKGRTTGLWTVKRYLRKTFGKFLRSFSELLSKFGEISFQEYISEVISHPFFYGDLVYKLRRVKCEANFVLSGLKIVKRLRRRKYDPVIIERTICLVFDFLQPCTYLS